MLWKKKEIQNNEQTIKQFLNDTINTVMYQHEQWDGKETRLKRKEYFDNLQDQYMVRGYGENYYGRATTAGSIYLSNLNFLEEEKRKKEDLYSNEEDSMLLDTQGNISRSQHYSKFQYVSNCWYFGMRAATLIASLLKQKTKNRLCKMSKNKLLSNVYFCEKLGQAYSENATVLGIKMEGVQHLEKKQLNAEGVQMLFQESLQQNNTVVMLHLRYNNIGTRGCNIIFESLRVNSRLHEIDLSYNNLNEKVAPMIATCLRENHILATLKLSHNLIGDEGIDVITDALWDNKGLKHLDVSYCQIGDAGNLVFWKMLIL